MSELDLTKLAQEQEEMEDDDVIGGVTTGPYFGSGAVKELQDFVWGWSEPELDGRNARTEMRS